MFLTDGYQTSKALESGNLSIKNPHLKAFRQDSVLTPNGAQLTCLTRASLSRFYPFCPSISQYTLLVKSFFTKPLCDIFEVIRSAPSTLEWWVFCSELLSSQSFTNFVHQKDPGECSRLRWWNGAYVWQWIELGKIYWSIVQMWIENIIVEILHPRKFW